MPARGRRRPRAKKPGEGTGINSRGGSRAWSALSHRVQQEEPLCRLRLPGCDVRSETADHIIPKCFRPDLAMVRRNLRGSCHWCNQRRGNRPLERVRAEMLANDDWKRLKDKKSGRKRRAAALAFFDKEETA